MSLLASMMQEGMRRKHIAQQSEQLQALIGTPGNPTPNSPFRATEATGIFTAPEENRAGLLADALLEGGQIGDGISTLQQLVARRENIVQQESQFQRSLFQNQQQFDDKEARELSEFQNEMTLKDAQRREQASQHLVDLTKSKLGIEKTTQDLAFAVEDNQRAVDAFGRIPTTEQEKFLAMADTHTTIKDAARDFKPEWAVNSTTEVGGHLIDLDGLRRKTDPSVADMEKLHFWDVTVNSMVLFLGQAISGAEISDQQRVEIGKLLPTVQDNPAEVEKKLHSWQNFWGSRLDRRMDTWVSQKRNVEPLLDLGLGQFNAEPLRLQPGAPPEALPPIDQSKIQFKEGEVRPPGF